MTDQTPDTGSEGLDAARAAKERMKIMHQEVLDQWPEVRDASETLYELRKRNHFAELIMTAMGRKS